MTDKRKTIEQMLENTRRELLKNTTRESFENTVHNNQPKFDPVILPVIGKFMSQQIANEIIGVQPMTSHSMTVGEMDHACSTWYWVIPPHDLSIPWEDMVSRNKEIQNWCDEIYGDKGDWSDPDCRWWASNRKYIFKNEEDRTMFVLRWS